MSAMHPSVSVACTLGYCACVLDEQQAPLGVDYTALLDNSLAQ